MRLKQEGEKQKETDVDGEKGVTGRQGGGGGPTFKKKTIAQVTVGRGNREKVGGNMLNGTDGMGDRAVMEEQSIFLSLPLPSAFLTQTQTIGYNCACLSEDNTNRCHTHLHTRTRTHTISVLMCS